jgi:hypothetical protein
MVVEIKRIDEQLRAPQRDTLSVFNSALEGILPIDGKPLNVKSRSGMIVKGKRKVVWHGIHMVRVPNQRAPLGPFWFDNRPCPSGTLIKLLDFDVDCNIWRKTGKLFMLDIDRRHKGEKQYSLFTGIIT